MFASRRRARRKSSPRGLRWSAPSPASEEGFGIFLDQSTKAALRLKVGDDYPGLETAWIKGGEVTMEKDQQAAVLTLPPPGGQSGEVQLIPVNAVKIPVATQR